MAEVFAVIGLAASILQCLDYGTKLVSRINEFQSQLDEVPKALQDISIILPLLCDGLAKIKEHLDAGHLSASTQRAFLPIVQGSHSQVAQLDNLLKTLLPEKNDPFWKKGKKAVRSIGHESDLRRLESILRENMQIMLQLLTFCQVVDYPKPEPNMINPSFMLRFDRDEKFVGRGEIIDQLHKQLKNHSRVALTGLGGVGKSQIAIEFCYQFRANNPMAHVFWVFANTSTRVEQTFKLMSQRLAIPGRDDPKADHLQLVSDWLSDENNGYWFIVLDNADDAAMFFDSKSHSTLNASRTSKTLADCLPRSPRGAMLITTRDTRVGERLADRNKPITVLKMTTTEAEVLIRSKISENEWSDSGGDLGELLDELAYLPLAITQAAAFISENSISISEYLKALRSGNEDLKELLSEHLEDPRRDPDTENSVMRTWKLSFDQVMKEQPCAAEILSLMAILDLQGVPRSLLRHYHRHKSEVVFKKAMGILQAFSLIKVEDVNFYKDTAFGMHRLVYLATQKWLDVRDTAAHWQMEALTLLTEVFPSPDFKDWAICEALTPHVQVVLSNTFTEKSNLLHCAQLRIKASTYDRERGRYPEAYTNGKNALEICQSVLPDEHPLLLESVHTVANVLDWQEKWTAAKEMYQRAASGRENVLGKDHFDTLKSRRGVAKILCREGDFEAAEKLTRKTLESMEMQFGPDDIETLHLTREKLLGPDHPSTLTSANDFAVVLGEQGKLDEASAILQRVATADDGLRRAAPQAKLIMLDNLADILNKRGDFRRAEELNQITRRAKEKLWGAGSRSTISTTQYLEDSLRLSGQYLETRELYGHTCRGRQKVLGEEHPDTISSLHHLATNLYFEGQTQKAEKVLRQAVKLRIKVFGLDDGCTLCNTDNLICKIPAQHAERYPMKQHAQASPNPKSTLDGDTARLIENEQLPPHLTDRLIRIPDAQDDLSIDYLLELRDMLDLEHNFEEAARVTQYLLASRTSQLGPRHPAVLGHRHSLGWYLSRQGKYQESEAVYRTVISEREDSLGTYHQDTLCSMYNLAVVIERQGLERVEEVEKLYRQVLAGFVQTLGSRSKQALYNLGDLQDFLERQESEAVVELTSRPNDVRSHDSELTEPFKTTS